MDKRYVVTVKESDIRELLRPKFGRFVKVKDMTVTPLTKFGDNFGSTILAVDVVLVSEKNRKLSMVAKLLPDNEFSRTVFNCDVSVRKEIYMYLLVSPEFTKIQQEHNVPINKRLDVFCECYGARATRGQDEGQHVDDSTAILLENLKTLGYRTGDRVAGLNLEHTEMVLDKLARFHATAIAIKLKKPFVFRNTVLKACKYFTIEFGPKERVIKERQDLASELRVVPEFDENFENLSECFLQDVDNAYSEVDPKPKEPFATIVHNDFGTNNMMFRYGTHNGDEGGTPVGFKIVDYQVTFYGSPVHDILFFLLTSTEYGLAEEHFDRFISAYHESLTDTLSVFGCDTKPFSLSALLVEMDRISRGVLSHALFMLNITTGDVGESSAEEPPEPGLITFIINDELRRKTAQAVRIYVQRGWL